MNGSKDGPTRYKMTEQNYLPKFAPAKRPISLAPAHVEHLPIVPKKLETPSLFDARLAAVVKVAPMMAPSVEVKNTVSKPVISTPVEKKSWMENIFNIFSARRSSRQPSQTAVQTELSINRISVVRNDLSETDLEVVQSGEQSKLAGVGAMTTVTEAAPEKTEKFKKVWKSVSGRFFKTETNVFK